MKNLFALFIALFLFIPFLHADEGMWVPSLLHKYNIEDMQAMGLKLSAEDLYSINQSSLKDAIVLFGRGCTGGVVSEEGLMLTNHHCGYGQIQSHSSIEHDYLTDGFWAMSREEELPNPGLTVSFLIRMEDVTGTILAGDNWDVPEQVRQDTIRARSQRVIQNAVKDTHYDAVVRPLFQGNQYFLYVMEIFKDVRLVGAPPSAIGKFGGDTDNWMWPRHTGDFSVFRIYADKENKPAEYSEDNVPYQPKKHFTVSLKGVEKGDFSMVYGYPYTTTSYLPSYMVEMFAGVEYPERIKIRQKKLDIIGAAMDADPEVRIQYASKDARIANAWKKWIGVIRGLKRLNAVEKKQELEKEFRNWAVSSSEGERYRTLLDEYKSAVDEATPLAYWRDYFVEAIFSTDVFNFASSFRSLSSMGKDEEEKIEQEISNLMNQTEGFFKNYHQPTDKKLFEAMMKIFYEGVSEEERPAIYDEIESKYGNDFAEYTEDVYGKSIFVSKERITGFLEKYKASKAKKLKKDPVFEAFMSFMEYYDNNIRNQFSGLRNMQDSLQRVYMAGLMEMQPDKLFYPDANATLRVAYGPVNEYFPRDAVHYKHYTTLEGIMEKDDPNIYDYRVPNKLKELYRKKDYGQYERADGQMPVCFIAMNHTTGGNSGSPVLNAEGHLIGLNFDRNWEGTMSDIMYDPDMCRNITLDIRYCLFIIDKFAGAEHLVREMTVVK
jgi:hypothetical protein